MTVSEMAAAKRRSRRGEKLPTPREVLEEGLSAYFRRPVKIARLRRQPWLASSHTIEGQFVRLDSGERLRVIFKQLRPRQKAPGNPREVLIYQRILTGQRFGAPTLYASLYDEAHDRYWLFMEDVEEGALSGADVDEWLAAVRWLAGMHRTYYGREQELREFGCLEEHGLPYYRSIAASAREHLSLASDGERLARFDRLMARYDSVVAHLTGQPRTLVHGDIYPDNLLFQPGPRIRPVDWESAGIGLPAWDLTRLLDGWERRRPIFIAAYLEEFAQGPAAPLDPQAFDRTLQYCTILNALWHLGWEVEDCRDPAFVDGLLDELQATWLRLEGGASDG
jgi:hypothetical protein